MKAALDNKAQIARMFKNSHTKLIAPVVTYGLLCAYLKSKDSLFSDRRIHQSYKAAVASITAFLGHDVHIGAKYYDAYGSRMSRYGVLEQIGHLQYRLNASYADEAAELCEWIPKQIKQHINERLGIVPRLKDALFRVEIADSPERFFTLVKEQISRTPANFEIFTFAVIKVHLEKFACKIYRDTRAASHDSGVDLSTNFGVVYQVKRLRVQTEAEANELYTELKLNFDNDRLQEGKIVLVIDEVSKSVRQFFIDMRVQSISKDDVLNLAANFEEPEDRQKVLRIIYDEFRREYSSRLPAS